MVEIIMLQPKIFSEYAEINSESYFFCVIPFVVLNISAITYLTVAFEEMITAFLEIFFSEKIRNLVKYK